MIRQRRQVVLRDADEYDREEREISTRNAPWTQWGDSTTAQLNRYWKRWEQFWRWRKEDPEQILRAPKYEQIKSFIERCLEESPYRLHRSSVRQIWKAISALYLHRTGLSMPLEIRRKMKMVLHPNKGEIIKKFDVICTPKPKATLYSDDLHVALLTEWRSPEMHFSSGSTRVTFWLWTLFTAGSGMRPGTMVENKRPSTLSDKEQISASKIEVTTSGQSVVTYGNCELTLYPPGVWLLKVDYRRRKGGGGKTSGLVFRYRSNACLASCPIMAFLARALADDAFEAQDLNTPERLYSLKVEPGLRCRPVTFKPSILDTPIFHTEAGNAWSYQTLRTHIVELSRATGFKEVLTAYSIRRGVANSINGKCSVAMQNQIMTHQERYGGDATYQAHYQDEVVQFDVQEAYFGCPSDKMLMTASNLLSSHLDPRLPRSLSAEELKEVQCSEEVQKLKEEQESLRQTILERFRFLKDAAGTDVLRDYESVRSKIQYASRRVRQDRLQLKQIEFRKHAAVDDVQRQIHGLPSTVPTDLPEPTYTHPEHGRLAQKLFSSELHEIGGEDDVRNRISVLTDLVALCKLRELPFRSATSPSNLAHSPVLHSIGDEVAQFGPSAAGGSSVAEFATMEYCDGDSVSTAQTGYTSTTAGMCPTPSLGQIDLTMADYSALDPCGPDLDCGEGSDVNFDAYFEHLINVEAVRKVLPRTEGSSLLLPQKVSPTTVQKDHTTRKDRRPIRLAASTCLFCHFDAAYGQAHKQASRYGRTYNLQRHAKRKHLQSTPTMCPDPACVGLTFKTIAHFKNHAEGVHGVSF